MSHDLPDPAATSRYFVDGYGGGDGPRRLQFIDTIERNLGKLIAMIENVSAYSKLQGDSGPHRAAWTSERSSAGFSRISRTNCAPPGSRSKGGGRVYPAFVSPDVRHVVANLVGETR